VEGECQQTPDSSLPQQDPPSDKGGQEEKPAYKELMKNRSTSTKTQDGASSLPSKGHSLPSRQARKSSPTTGRPILKGRWRIQGSTSTGIFSLSSFFFPHNHPRRTVTRTSNTIRTHAHKHPRLRPRKKTVFGQNGGSGEEEAQEQQEEFIVPKPSPSYYRRL